MFRFLLTLIFVLLPLHAFAEATLSYAPQRVIMGDRDRTATLRITNRGDAPGTYRIEMSDVVYQEDGGIRHSETTPPGFPSAKPFIRFSPRQVRLQPGETQRVRILARPPADASGEYRVHAVLRRLPEPSTTNAGKAEDVVSGAVGITQSVALPIILRRGQINVRGGLREAQRKDDAVALTLWREGNASLYVDLRAYRGAETEENEVSIVRGVSVPVPNLARKYNLGLRGAAPGKLTVTMTDHYTGEVIDRRLTE